MRIVTDWSAFKSFSKEEFDCQETGENQMHVAFMERLQLLRERYGKLMVITSGYRSPKHSIEARKREPGTHAQGIAADIAIKPQDRYRFIKLAYELGFTGIGVDDHFVHLDIRKSNFAIWSY